MGKINILLIFKYFFNILAFLRKNAFFCFLCFIRAIFYIKYLNTFCIENHSYKSRLSMISAYTINFHTIHSRLLSLCLQLKEQDSVTGLWEHLLRTPHMFGLGKYILLTVWMTFGILDKMTKNTKGLCPRRTHWFADFLRGLWDRTQPKISSKPLFCKVSYVWMYVWG